MKPQVSIIVTVYKRTDFLNEALASAMSQTFSGYEIIVADDSGSQAARAVCEPLMDAGILRYLPNERTVGIAASVRGAIGKAEGEFIAILNDDDAWEPDFLSRLVAPLQNDRARVIAFSDHWIISESGSIDYKASEANTKNYGRAGLAEGEIGDPARFVLIENGVPLAMASLFRRSALDLSLLTDQVAGAYDFWISCLLAASNGKFYFVPERLTRYRMHRRMETARSDPAKSQNHVYIFSQLLERNWFPKLRNYLRSRLAEAFFQLGRDKLDFNQNREARDCFHQSFRIKPGLRSLIAILASFVPQSVRVQLGFSRVGLR